MANINQRGIPSHFEIIICDQRKLNLLPRPTGLQLGNQSESAFSRIVALLGRSECIAP